MGLIKIFEQYFKPCHYEPEKEDVEICKKCCGSCCKSMGCHISPFDLREISVDSITSLIEESNCISIDWWEGNPINNEQDGSRAYFLRIKNENGKIIDPSFGGRCSILTDTGCPLPFEYRPKGARELIPSENKKDCKPVYSKQQCAIDWYDYQDIMEEVYDYFNTYEDIFCIPNILNVFDMFLGGCNE